MAGEVFSSARIILSLIQNLPEGSRFYAANAVDHPLSEGEKRDPDPRLEAIAERREWNTDRRLIAMVINAINLNTACNGNWGEKPPEFPTIGPADWSKEPVKEEPKDLRDYWKQMGWPMGADVIVVP